MKIAITGTIGSGKSTVCSYLASKGYDVFDCDKENALLLEKGTSAYKEIELLFPDAFENGNLNKSLLANIVFNDVNLKKKLEDILHPCILMKMLLESNNKDLFIAEVPLLFESGWDQLFDVTILVSCDKDIAINRLLERGMSKEEATKRFSSQMSSEIKEKRADEIIYNNGSLDDLFKRVDEVLAKYVR